MGGEPMTFEQQIDYLNKTLSAGKIIARGKPVRPHSHSDHPARWIQGVKFVLGENESNFYLRIFDGYEIQPEQLDALAANIENLIMLWE